MYTFKKKRHVSNKNEKETAKNSFYLNKESSCTVLISLFMN